MSRRRAAERPFLLVEEVAARLRLEPDDVRGLIRDGELPALVLPGDIMRIAPDDLETFIAARTHPYATSWRPPLIITPNGG